MRRSGIAGLAGMGLGLAAGAATAGGFQLREGCNPVPQGEPDFYRCYEDVGAFPEVDLPLKTVYTRILTAFGAGLVPIL